MTPAATAYSADTRHLGWFGKSEAWLDSKGKGAWIAAMVLGFVFFWPIGLALLFYMIWSKDMFKKSHRSRSCSRRMHVMTPTGNSAFDSYRDETLRRLEDEQKSFEEFLERLRAAKDKAEFDQFMDERATKAANAKQETEDA
ncbi:DUF2852 domain-containing protein [Shimia sp. R9_1]|uniref:DUF2852 domain-containing protein n=1 Tax=unclassified Shimia TaxID=2630038 RepID=UPI001ADA4E2D|nr:MULTISPECIES: DUF2852 domain-containing protein [unclassified Shimia]MBO9397403.1 DUF2852 domain-containing protein [Shimia sp. R9_2]MBO9402025.1 DUF2852 domain-containing protein [Shimia sp. R9_3]MBO9408644.1 DUF2852 domain-containing protein [Shimia sp. R9_1]